MATRRRSCKYGKLKRKTRGRRCRKSRRSRSRRRRSRRRRKACKARFPSSLSNLMSKVLKLGREKLSLAKRIQKANNAMNSESDPVKKLQKQLVAQKLGEVRGKVLEDFQKSQDKLNAKLAEYASKSAVKAALVQDEKKKFDVKYDKMMSG